MLEHVAWTEYVINTYTIFVGKPKRERPFGKITRRWKDNIRKTEEQDLKDWTVLDWTRTGLNRWLF